MSGEEKTGILEAKDAHQLAQSLRQEGLVLVRADIEKKEEKKSKFEISLPFLNKVSLTEKLMFSRNLQVMIASGLPLPRTLKTLVSQAKNKKFKAALTDIQEEINKGKNFSDSLSKYPDIFSELFRNMIKIGEETGTMEDVLKVLIQQMEGEHELKSKVAGAMVYPAVIICVMILIGILMLVMVVPKLAETFKDLGVELPITTRIVIGTAGLLTKRWYLFIAFLISIFLLFSQGKKIKSFKKIIDKVSLKIPVISVIIKKTNAAYTARNLGALIAAGVPLPRSLEITAGTMGNVFYQKAIIESAEKVRKGQKLSEALSIYQDIYPQVVIQMIAVGEETGETSAILSKLAIFFEEEVSNAAKNLTSVIEPLLMAVVGAVIGFFAISMMQPMYSMLGAIK